MARGGVGSGALGAQAPVCGSGQGPGQGRKRGCVVRLGRCLGTGRKHVQASPLWADTVPLPSFPNPGEENHSQSILHGLAQRHTGPVIGAAGGKSAQRCPRQGLSEATMELGWEPSWAPLVICPLCWGFPTQLWDPQGSRHQVQTAAGEGEGEARLSGCAAGGRPGWGLRPGKYYLGPNPGIWRPYPCLPKLLPR